MWYSRRVKRMLGIFCVIMSGIAGFSVTNIVEDDISYPLFNTIGKVYARKPLPPRPPHPSLHTREFKVIWGDVNSDERIDEKDFQLLNDYVNENIKEYRLDLCVADVNNDDNVDVKDVEYINDYLEGKPTPDNRTGEIKKIIKQPMVSHYPPPSRPRKPVIYLYPIEKTLVSVNLKFNGKLTCTYPPLGNGWTVTAKPDGQLTDNNGMKYNYLFWEGESNVPMNFDTGFCIAGKDTAEFLQKKLRYLGLNSREINEFIIYWLPQMQGNPYNVISFQTKNYEESAVLDVTPVPETTIRVFMAWKKADNKVAIAPQKIVKAERKGYTLVEWGGCEVVENSINNKFE